MTARAIERLFAACSGEAGAEALRFQGAARTFGELDGAARRYARGLADLGIRRGDRVAVFAEASPEVAIALLGHYRAGAIHVPINTRYRMEETRHILSDSGAAAVLVRAGGAGEEMMRNLASEGAAPRAIVIGGSGRARREDVVFERLLESDEAPDELEAADGDTATIVYTSGTTGKSKGAALSFRALVSNISALTDLWRFSSSDRVVIALPLFHVHGLCIGVHGWLLHGATLLLFERFDAREIVRAFAELGATVFMGVPTMYVRLLELFSKDAGAAAALSRGRLFTSGSAALPAADFGAFERATGHRILERYGMTETLFTISNPYDGERRAGTVGFPVPGCEILLVGDDGREIGPGEAGEVLVRSNGIMSEYWGRPAETRAAFRDGWFTTGDLARRDRDGYVSMLGRKSTDFIKSGGFKISAREIEEVIAAHPNVGEVAVVGMPDRMWGERVVSAVVLRRECDRETLESEIEELCARSLADYKRPREVRVLSELPRNAMGKVVKPRIVEMLKPGKRKA